MSDVEQAIDRQLAAVETEAERWHNARLCGIGASEVATLFDADPFHSRYELWLRKRGLIPPTADDPHRRFGRKMESVIASEYVEATGRTIHDPGRHTVCAMAGHPRVLATLDRLILGDLEGVLEIKATHAFRTADWHNGPPLRVLLQLHQQMAVTGATWGSVAVLPYPAPLQWWDVAADAELHGILIDTIETFWRVHIEGGEPPPIDAHRATRAALLARRPVDMIPLRYLPAGTADVLAIIEGAREVIRGQRRIVDFGENMIRAAMDGASAALLPDGRRIRDRVSEIPAHERAASERRQLLVDSERKSRRLAAHEEE